MYEELVSEYLEYNPPELFERERYHIDLPKPKQRNLIHTLIGVRRCGKTFCLFQLMKELIDAGVSRRRILFVPFDDDRLDLGRDDVAACVLEAYFKLVPEAHEGCYLFFDEIQEAPNWDAFVRRVAEQYPTTVVITGSSSKLLSTDIPTKLRGRSLSTEVWPFSFKEFCQVRGIDTNMAGGAVSPTRRGVLERALDDYLTIGGFPAVQNLSPADRVRLLQAYADEIVTKDVLERFETASFRVGRRYARTALRSTGLKFSVNKQIKGFRSLGLSISDAAAYALLDDFEDAHLVFKVADYSLSVKDNPKSSYKLYSVDQGLSLAVAPASHIDLGQRLETAVFIELKRRFGANRDNVIARYSTASCPEVDFVVGDVLLETSYALVQVAAESGLERDGGDDKKLRSELGNLESAMKETGLSEGTIVTLSGEREVVVDAGRIHIIPAWKWLLIQD